MDLKDYIGKPTGAGSIHLERGSVSRFAHAVTDANPVYHDQKAAREAGFDNCPLPPTWTFAAEFLGVWPEDKPADPTGGAGNPMMKIIGNLMKGGGLILHGEQEFRYHQVPQAGEVLHWEGKITDIYTKESKGKVMTFIVMENEFTNSKGEPVITEIFNLIHRGA
jgi:acyl dehydratase